MCLACISCELMIVGRYHLLISDLYKIRAAIPWIRHGSPHYVSGSSYLCGHHHQVYGWGNRGTARRVVAWLKLLWEMLCPLRGEGSSQTLVQIQPLPPCLLSAPCLGVRLRSMGYSVRPQYCVQQYLPSLPPLCLLLLFVAKWTSDGLTNSSSL